MIDVALLVTLLLAGLTLMYVMSVLSKGAKDSAAKEGKKEEVHAEAEEEEEEAQDAQGEVLVVYSSHTGTCEELANLLERELTQSLDIKCALLRVDHYDWELALEEERRVLLAVLPTYEGGTPAPDAKSFYGWLEEEQADFRKGNYTHLRYAVFGAGDSAYGDNWSSVSRRVHLWLRKLGGKHLLAHVRGDGAGTHDHFQSWMERLTPSLLVHLGRKDQLRAIKAKMREIVVDEDEEEAEDDDDSDDSDESEAPESPLVDLEDMGDQILPAGSAAAPAAPKKMVSASLHRSLTKQGYKIVGSHSGVKLCRWTKAQMRGRGGCYKNCFYGIESYRCMEATPSLACASKCTFCWRHHKNPVGKSWKWEMDEPEMLIDKFIEEHKGMVKQLKGVPGIIPERYEKAFVVRHCALSLVGEPIMYPKINQFVRMLHERSISSFMVTNAQFPEETRNLVPVTQMYLSIDGATEESLKAVDRPVHSDFWQRFLDSIDALRENKQRTVFRLTLVKGWNMEEIKEYATLVERGMPGLIEIKGVTYTGDSKASDLTIKNSPYYEEVIHFVGKLVDAINERLGEDRYALACEHRHSVCYLVADKRTYLVDGVWHTWIDYNKFQELFASGEPFTAADYMDRTPEWALFGHEAHGFNPAETRFFRKGKSAKSRDDKAKEAGVRAIED